MNRAYSSLICSHQPAFEQRSHQMSFGEQLVTDLGIFANYFANVAMSAYSIVTLPAIGLDNTTRFYVILNSILQALSRGIRYSLKTNSSNFPTVFLRCNNNKFFVFCTTTTFTRFFPANKSFVYFDSATESITTWTHHRTTQFVEPRPSCSVTAKTKCSLQTQSVGPIFSIRNMPNRIKPNLQRLFDVLKNCTGEKRSLHSTLIAVVKIAISKPSFLVSTLWASKPFRPTQFQKVLAAGFLGREIIFKFQQVFGVIIHDEDILHVVVTWVKCISKLIIN